MLYGLLSDKGSGVDRGTRGCYGHLADANTVIVVRAPWATFVSSFFFCGQASLSLGVYILLECVSAFTQGNKGMSG